MLKVERVRSPYAPFTFGAAMPADTKNHFNCNHLEKKMNLRKIVSLTMLVSFALCVLTSVVLYITPHGRVAFWSNWRFWGLSKTQWSDLHLNLGILLLLAGFMHIYYNWRPIKAYLKDRARHMKVFTAEFNIALLLAVIVGVGTVYRIPPMSSILDISESIKEAAAQKYGEPPYGHAELSSLKMFARRCGLDLARSMELLRKAGIKFSNERQTIAEIAAANNLTPRQVFDIIKTATQKQEAGAMAGLPDTPPPGFGRKKFADICGEYRLDCLKIEEVLALRGIKVEPNQTIKEIAAGNGMNPMAVFEIIKEAAHKSR
jgi:hypothetical protein